MLFNYLLFINYYYFLLQTLDELEKKRVATLANSQIHNPPRAFVYETLAQSLTFVQTALTARFPDHGANNSNFARAHLLHPNYKGAVMKISGDRMLWQFTRDDLVASHPTTIAWNEAREPGSEPNPNDAMLNRTEDDDIIGKLLAKVNTEEYAEVADEAPLEAELNFFLKQKCNDRDVDVLAWWKANKEQYKLLSVVAR